MLLLSFLNCCTMPFSCFFKFILCRLLCGCMLFQLKPMCLFIFLLHFNQFFSMFDIYKRRFSTPQNMWWWKSV